MHSKRKQYKNGVVDSIMYYINDSVYGSFAYTMDRKNAKLSLLDKVNDFHFTFKQANNSYLTYFSEQKRWNSVQQYHLGSHLL